MSGIKRIAVGEITQKKLQGKALVEALSRLNSTSAAQTTPKVSAKTKKGK